MSNNECHFCGKEIPGQPIEVIVEKNIARDGIEADVECINYYCSEECKNDDNG